MDKLGEYANENFSLINIVEVNSDNLTEVKIHEIIHMLLAQQTKWGIMEYLFNHIGRLIDDKYLYIAKKINSSCIFVQESLAEFWEKLYIYQKKGEQACIDKIEEQEWENPGTYDYLKKILEIIKNRGELSIDNIAYCLYRIALNSMSIDILDKSDDFWHKTDFSKEKIPDNFYKSKLLEFENAIKLGNIDLFMQNIECEWCKADLDEREKYIKHMIQYIKEICHSSKYEEQINTYLSTITCKYIDQNRIEEYLIPHSYNNYSFDKNISIIENTSQIAFIFGDASDIRYTFKNSCINKNTLDKNVTYIQNKICLLYYDYETKKMSADIISYSQFKKKIRKNNKIIVVSYKALENNNRLMRLRV